MVDNPGPPRKTTSRVNQSRVGAVRVGFAPPTKYLEQPAPPEIPLYMWYRPPTDSTPSPSTDLTEGLVAYWKVDEATGNDRADSVNVGDALTGDAVGTPGLINNAAFITVAGAESLSTADMTYIEKFTPNAGAFSISFWFNPSVIPAVLGTFMTFDLDGDGHSILFTNEVSGAFGFTCPDAVGDPIKLAVGVANDNVWNHIVCFHNGSDTMGYHMNNSPALTIPILGLFSPTPTAPTVLFSASADLDYAIDEVGIWRRQLTQDDVFQLFNGGAGLSWPFA